MQLSKRRINKTLEEQLKKMFYGVLTEIKSMDQMKLVLDDLLTKAERTAVYKRLGIALYLDKGRSYRDIKNHIKVSSATVASVAEDVGRAGYQELVRRIKADEWASEWSGKISKRLKNIWR